MRFLSKIDPTWSLRIGTGLMYIYSGQDLIIEPSTWRWAMPMWLQNAINSVIPIDRYLQIQGCIELLMAFAFLAWFLSKRYVKWAAAISSIEMFIILWLSLVPFNQPNFYVTFRDLGLLGGSFALFLLLRREESGSTL